MQSHILKIFSVPSVTIFVRHKAVCSRRSDPFYRSCRCSKHLRWSYGGKQYRKAAKTRAWATAEERRRQLEDQFRLSEPSRPIESVTMQTEVRKTIKRAIELFLADKRSQGLDPTADKKYERELSRLDDFMTKRGRLFPHEMGLDDLTEFRAEWLQQYPSSTTRSKVQERLRGFLRYCVNAKMMDQVPHLSAIKIVEPPTLPLTGKQYEHLLEVIPKEFPAAAKARRTHALIQAMRHSGLAIQDAVTLERAELKHDAAKNVHRIVTSRQKTGTHVSVPLPPEVAEEILSVMKLNGHPDYIFWNRVGGKQKAAVDVWERALKRAFMAAGMPEGHSHQLRDTFAVSMLQNGVPMEEVSKLLGHTSIKTTEKSYAPWVRSRQDRLDTLVVGTWSMTANANG